MKKIVTLSGDIGGGKSSVARSLAQTLGYEMLGTGTIQRSIARKRGLTTLELNELSATDSSVDDEIDHYVIELGKSRDALVIDSRLAWHFIPGSFKVFLIVDPLIGAERVFNDQRDEEDNPSIEQTLHNNSHRQALEALRFEKLYGIEFRAYHNYDLIIDTSYTGPDAIAERVKSIYRQRSDSQPFFNYWISTQRIFPSQSLSELEVTSINASDQGEAQPVDVVINDNFFYLYNGHQQLMASHAAGIDLVPVNVIASRQKDRLACGRSVEQFIAAIHSSWIDEWETELGFEFKQRPR